MIPSLYDLWSCLLMTGSRHHWRRWCILWLNNWHVYAVSYGFESAVSCGCEFVVLLKLVDSILAQKAVLTFALSFDVCLTVLLALVVMGGILLPLLWVRLVPLVLEEDSFYAAIYTALTSVAIRYCLLKLDIDCGTDACGACVDECQCVKGSPTLARQYCSISGPFNIIDYVFILYVCWHLDCRHLFFFLCWDFADKVFFSYWHACFLFSFTLEKTLCRYFAKFSCWL